MRLLIYCAIIIIFASTSFSNAFLINPAETDDKKETENYNNARNGQLKDEDSDYSILISGGFGLTTGSCWGFWEKQFYNGPALDLAIELPFASSDFSFESSILVWMSKMSDKINPSYNEFDKEAYINIYKEIYSQTGFAGNFKYYLGGKEDIFKASIQLGYLVCYPDFKNFVDFGYSLYYRIADTGILSLSHRFYLGRDFNAKSTIDTPNYLLLNYSQVIDI